MILVIISSSSRSTVVFGGSLLKVLGGPATVPSLITHPNSSGNYTFPALGLYVLLGLALSGSGMGLLSHS